MEHLAKISLVQFCKQNLNSNLIRLASTENIDISASITQIDGIQLADTDLVLIKNQDDLIQNGIYRYNTDSGQLVSLIDLNNLTDLQNYVFNNNQFYIYKIIEGLINKNKYFLIKKLNQNIKFQNIDFNENLRRYISLFRISNQNNQDINFNQVINIKDRDYYFKSLYLGNMENH